jgi:hypothetical protein
MFKYPFFSFLCLMCTSFYCFADFYVPSNLPLDSTGESFDSFFYQLSNNGVIKNQVQLSPNSVVNCGIAFKENLYFGGGVVNESGEEFAILWISDLKGNKVVKKEISPGEFILDLIENEGQLFLVGRKNKFATLWVFDLQGNEIKNEFLHAAEDKESSAQRILKVDDKIYVTGFIENDEEKREPILWILNEKGVEISENKLNNIEGVTAAGPIVSIRNKLYILAYEGLATKTDASAPIIWITDLNGKVLETKQFDDLQGSIPSDLFVHRSRVVAVGLKNSAAAFWVLDSNGNLVSQSSFGEVVSGIASGISSGSTFQMIGVSGISNMDFQNTFWKVSLDGRVRLERFFNKSIPAKIIRIDTFEDSLLRANQLFSPIRPQQGVN